jgi:hypothetical protein
MPDTRTFRNINQLKAGKIYNKIIGNAMNDITANINNIL